MAFLTNYFQPICAGICSALTPKFIHFSRLLEIPSFLQLPCHHSEKFSIHHLCKDRLVIGRLDCKATKRGMQNWFPRRANYTFLSNLDISNDWGMCAIVGLQIIEKLEIIVTIITIITFFIIIIATIISITLKRSCLYILDCHQWGAWVNYGKLAAKLGRFSNKSPPIVPAKDSTTHFK